MFNCDRFDADIWFDVSFGYRRLQHFEVWRLGMCGRPEMAVQALILRIDGIASFVRTRMFEAFMYRPTVILQCKLLPCQL